MNRALIVEDDKVQAESLRIALNKIYPAMKTSTVYNSKSAIHEITESIASGKLYSLFLLDIQLSVDSANRGGFEIANYLRRQKEYFTTPILFLTLIKDDVKIALHNYHCYNYITKPYAPEDVIFELEQMLLTGILREQSISVVDTDGIKHHIELKQLVYIRVKSHVLSLVTTLGTIRTRGFSLSSIQNYLNPDFVKCHLSYLININYVTSYDKSNRCINLGKHLIPVSRTCTRFLEEAMKQHNIFL